MADSPLVGRDRELAQLEQLLKGAREGGGGLAVLFSEPGAGKTRLLQELAVRAARSGMACARGAAWESATGIPFLAIAGALNDLLDAADTEALRRTVGASSAILSWLAPRFGTPPGERLTADLKPVLFEALAGLLKAAGRGRGALVVVDDAHWADSSSLEVLEYLSRRAGRLGLAVVVAWRDAPGLPDSERLRRVPGSLLVRLEPLGSAEIARLAGALIDAAAPERLLREVVERSRGNPLLAERLALAAATGRPGQDLPADLRQAILGSATDLEASERPVLDAAAVIGNHIQVATLALVTGLDEARCRTVLRKLTTSRLLDEGATSEDFRFHHQLIRDAIYSEIAPPERRDLHARVAEAATELSAAERGRHLLSAGRHAEAVTALAEGAREAAAHAGFREAADLYLVAAEAAADDRERGDLLSLAGHALTNGFVIAEGIDLLERGVQLIERAGGRPGIHRTHLGFAYSFSAREPKESLAAYRAAVAELEPDGPSADLAAALVMLGVHYVIIRLEPEEALVYAERAIQTANAVGDERDAALGQGVMAGVLGMLDRVDEAIRLGDEASRRLLDLGELAPATIGIHNFANMRTHVFRAREAVDDRLPLLDQPPLAGSFPYLKQRLSAFLFTALGRFDDVVALAEQEGDVDPGLNVRLHWTWARALAELDRLDEARAALADFPAARAGDIGVAMVRSRLAVLTALALGDTERAAAESIAQPQTGMGFYGTRFYVEPGVEALMAAGRPAEARTIVDSLRPIAVAGDPYWELTLARIGEGRVAAVLEGANTFERAGYRPDACRALQLAAEMLLSAGDRGAAADQLRRMLAVAKAGRLPRLARVARERLHALGEPSDLVSSDQVRRLLENLSAADPALRDRICGTIDALAAAGGREAEAAVVLRDYYVKRIGSQEVVAERHYLTRPTFYRRLHLGWELLAQRLGALEEVGPTSRP